MNTITLALRTKKFLIGTVILATFFPYISIIDTPFDTQPWALLLSMLLLLFVAGKERSKVLRSAPAPLIVLSLILFYASLLFFVKVISSGVDYLAGFRSIWGYLSLVVMTYVGYRFWPLVSAKLFLGGTVVWFLTAITQLLFGTTIVATLLPRFSTGGFRGLTSLAPEPAFYANVLLYLLVLNEFFYTEKKYNTVWYFFVASVILLQVVLSYSGVGIMMLGLFTGAKGIQLLFIKGDFIEKKKQLAIIVMCMSSVGVFYANTHMRETRAGSLITTAVSDPQALKKDASVSGRLINPIIGFNGGIVQTKGGGYGIGNESKVTPPDWLAVAYLNNRTVGNRIEGGVPQSIYELGIVGFGLLGALVYILFKAMIHAREQRSAIIASSFVIFLPILFFGSLANPLLGLLLGINLFYAYKV